MFKPGHWPVATNSLFLWQALAVAVFPLQSTYSAVLESAKKDGCPLSSDFYTGGMKKSMLWTYSREEAEEKARKGYFFYSQHACFENSYVSASGRKGGKE